MDELGWKDFFYSIEEEGGFIGGPARRRADLPQSKRELVDSLLVMLLKPVKDSRLEQFED